MKLLTIIVNVYFIRCALGARILVIQPMPAPSHAILIERLLRALNEKGNEITYVTALEPIKPLGRTNVIYVPGIKNVLHQGMLQANSATNLLLMRGLSKWLSNFFMQKLGTSVSEYILSQEQVKNIIKSTQSFDLILGEIYLDESVLAGFSKRFNAPIVAVQPLMAGHWANNLVGNPAPASIIPDPLIGFSSKMNFFERMANFFYTTISEFVYVHHTLHAHDTIMRKHFDQDYPPLQDILKNTSLVLVNYHFSLGFTRPYLPNMVEVAGMHIEKPNPLPQDLQQLMDNTKEGVILFSLGSTVKSKDMPPAKIEALLKAFARMQQTILWKLETDLANLPKNVKIVPWLPQSDILAHPNLKLFITHGGLLSTTEAVDRGVPVVGIPILGDQPANMVHMEMAGLGLTLNYEDLSEDAMYNTVMEVLTNPKYKEAAQMRSMLLRDTPDDSLERAIWWIEYVLRHKGARHLRSASQDLTWYQRYLLDVYALAALIIIPILYVSVCTIKITFAKMLDCKASQKVNVNKKNE